MVQGLKSLAAKLHPQLPLSPKESQRLLTALTSSFRRQLEDAHPRKVKEAEDRPLQAAGGALKHALHTSSVALADRHLASVLTNPLLSKDHRVAKPSLDYETAKQELEQDPDKDPVAVLEEYHAKGAATLLIAELCLRIFRARLVPLTPEDRQATMTKYQAGVRTLRWLWDSQLHDSNEFVDKPGLMKPLAEMMVEEKNEHFLWSWLRIDLRLGSQILPPGKPASRTHYYHYRWKGALIRCIVFARQDDQNPASTNDILEAYLKAVQLYTEVAQESTGNTIPLLPAYMKLGAHLFRRRQQRKIWHAKHYDQLVQSLDLLENTHPREKLLAEYRKALLYLSHPKRPSPLPMLDSLKRTWAADYKSYEACIRVILENKRPRLHDKSKIGHENYFIFLETARQLQALGRIEDRDWILSCVRDNFPELAQFIATDLVDGIKQARWLEKDVAYEMQSPVWHQDSRATSWVPST